MPAPYLLLVGSTFPGYHPGSQWCRANDLTPSSRHERILLVGRYGAGTATPKHAMARGPGNRSGADRNATSNAERCQSRQSDSERADSRNPYTLETHTTVDTIKTLGLYIADGAGSRFVGQRVNLGEPPSVALLAMAERALSQATKPFVDRHAAAMTQYATITEPTDKQTAAHDASLASIETRRAESPAVIAAIAEIARLTAIVADDRAKQKPVTFAPLSHDGITATTRTRYALTAEQLAAWEAETDGDKRTAILAGASSTQHGKSVVAITREQQSALVPGTYADRAALDAALRAGHVAIPVTRAAKAAKTAKGKRSPDQRTEAALDFLFEGLETVETPATDDTTPPVTPTA